MAIDWVFDPAPPSGQRTGGKAAEYSFEGKIDVLVRESVQNAIDEGVKDDTPVKIVYRIIDLTGEQLGEFQDAISWSSLEDNLSAVPEKRGGKLIADSIQKMKSSDSS